MRTIVILTVVVALCSAASADRTTAERLFRAGEKAYRAQKFLIAAQNFEQAYNELSAPELAFSAAQAYRRQYRVDPAHPEYVELAVKYYQIYIREQKGGTRVGDAADSLGEMLHELDRLGMAGKVRAGSQEQKTMLGVSVVYADRQQATGMHEVDEDKDKDAADKNAPVAKAFIDGKPTELDALIEVPPGDHTVRAEAPGYQPVEQTTHVVKGAPRNAELTLQPLPANVTVKTEPGASIIVDGRGVGDAPQAPLHLIGGSHVITVIRTGRRPVAREVVVTRDEKLTVPFELHPTARRRSVPFVIGVGGLFVVSTGVMLLGAKHFDTKAVQQKKLLDMGDQPESVLADYNTYRTRRDRLVVGAYVGGGAAVAIGLAAAWLYYFDTPSAEGVHVQPYASPTGGGAAISGRF